MVNQNTTKILMYLVLALMLSSCSERTKNGTAYLEPKRISIDSLFSKPAIPDTNLSVSEALKYVSETDQGDRAKIQSKDFKGISERNSPVLERINDRDSLRFAVVWKFYESNQIISAEDKYNAAVVLTHSGGSKVKKDTLSWQIAKKFLTEASIEGDSLTQERALEFIDFVNFRLSPHKKKGITIELN